ncbi:MAG TPA: hypothetical protein DIC36_07825 [Gammaproteobacteria bacterium]|nr:hypothetical protein [Gammaproteobacteria bacterium]
MFRTRSRSLVTHVMLIAMGLLAISSPAVGRDNACSILPAGASALGAPRLCRFDSRDEHELAVCREYSDDQKIYQLVYQGGTMPVAMYISAGTKFTKMKLEIPDQPNAGRQRCKLLRPDELPAAAIYRGTGVCQDELGQPLPCSLFEHAGAREPEARRYFVYYEPDGSGVRHIDVLPAGPNKHAFEAELAFQVGQSLVNADCCRDRARAYLAYAANLFPDDGLYRAVLTVHLNDAVREQSSPLASFTRLLDRSQ